MKLLPWSWLKRKVSAKIKRYGYFSHPLDDKHGISPEAFGQTSRYYCRNSSEKLQKNFVIIKGMGSWMGSWMGSYHLKAQLQMQSAGALFCVLLWSNNQLLSKFYYLHTFSPCFNQLVIEFFRSKEDLQKKFNSNNNWKPSWSGMSLKWHLFLRLSLGFARKILVFVGKNHIFTQKISIHFLHFLFKWRGVNPIKKYIENEIFDSTSHKAKKTK